MSLPRHSDVALAFLLAWTAKATALLAVAWIAALASRRRSAGWRHQLWTIAILGSLALPLLGAILPVWHPALLQPAVQPWRARPSAATSTSPEAVPPASTATMATPIVSIRNSSYSKITRFVIVIWAFGSLLALLRLLVGVLRVAWSGRRSKVLLDDGWVRMAGELCQSFGVKRSVRLLACPSPTAMPATWGVLRPRIILPANASEWTAERRRIVLAHELTHIRRQDWLVQICGELLRSLLWFDPLAWVAASHLRLESERACDDSVLNSGVEASEYASQLLTLARSLKGGGRQFAAALAIARPSNLERRFAAMLSHSIDRSPLSKNTRILATVLGVCLLVPLAALGLRAQALSGAFVGTVYDPSGAIVQNAAVTMTNQKADTTDTTKSDAVGKFRFMALPAGDYELQVLSSGFQRYTAPVVLEAGRDLSVNVNLTIGAVQQMVNVKSDSAALSSRSTDNPPSADLRVGGTVTAARLLTQVPPVYPPSARTDGTEGRVILHAVIGKDGKLLSLRVANTQVDPDLARAAMDAVSQWVYNPTLLDGQPVEIQTTITISFTGPQ